MTDNEKLMKYYLKVREKGRIRYSIEQGLIFGFIVFIVSNLINLVDQPFSEVYFSWGGLLNLGMYLIIGIFFYGSFMWWVSGQTIKKNSKIEEKSN